MNIAPDFPEHWKTRMLCESLADASAPLYVLRLWAHCERKKRWQFDNLSPQALKALCLFPGHANQLVSSLQASGFIRIEEKVLTAVNFDEHNPDLIAAWEKEAEKEAKKPKPKAKKMDLQPPASNGQTTAAKWPIELATPEFKALWERWIKHRAEIKSPLTPEQIKGQLKMLAGKGLDEATMMIEHTIEKGWRGLRMPDADDSFSLRRSPANATTKKMKPMSEIGGMDDG